MIVASLAFLAFGPRLQQDSKYHEFAGPAWANVLTNMPFGVLGIWGWRQARQRRSALASLLIATGLVLTCLGSAYYHSSPSDGRLVWDRLPMTLIFLPLLALVLGA